MKKIFATVLFVFVITILLVACSSKGDDSFDDSAWVEDLGASQKIEVVNAENDDTISIITDTTEIETFSNSLDIGSWKIAKLPENAEKQMIFILYNIETANLGESKEDMPLMEVGRITTYDNCSYITFKTNIISFDFKVSDKAIEYLNSLS